jgi:predicted nucleic acid-binding protein
VALALLGASLEDGARLAVDSAPIIYFLEDHRQFAARYAPLFDAAARGDCSVVVSTITLAEVVAGPLGAGNEVLAAQYHRALKESANWRLVPLSDEIAFLAARIRSSRGLRLPDAIQVATAVTEGCAALVTHDVDFRKVSEIKILS